jgi:hypothetical protein
METSRGTLASPFVCCFGKLWLWVVECRTAPSTCNSELLEDTMYHQKLLEDISLQVTKEPQITVTLKILVFSHILKFHDLVVLEIQITFNLFI